MSGVEQTVVHGAHRRPRHLTGPNPGQGHGPGPGPQAATPGASYRQPCSRNQDVGSSDTRTVRLRYPVEELGVLRARRQPHAMTLGADRIWIRRHGVELPQWPYFNACTCLRLLAPPTGSIPIPSKPPTCAAALSWWTSGRLVILISLAGPVRSACERNRSSPVSGGVGVGRRSKRPRVVDGGVQRVP